jgi:VanW like protein/glycosyl transferase family 1
MTVISGTRPERWRRPTRASMALFEAKATAFRLRRSLTELGRAPRRLAKATAAGDFTHVAAESVSELWSDLNLAERGLQMGKVQNLRRAAAALDGLALPAGAVFSFWRQVRRATPARGYVEGRMLREGCMMAAVGGGLCQLSNALYDAALAAGCEIVERHAHSQVVPGSAAAAGRDATVAWNYVDLRFVSPEPRLLRVILGARTLTVRLLARMPAAVPDRPAAGDEAAIGAGAVERCSDCDQTDCFLHEHGARSALAAGRAAFLVDEAWPELKDYVGSAADAGDLMAAPDFRRWSGAGFAEARQARLASAMRSLGWRLTPPQGAARRSADARATAAIAARLARALTPDVLDVTVAQSLLPYLWRSGALGGRRLTVLMTRLPVAALQARLDAAFDEHPERGTLADYRAEPWLAAAESEALAAAEAVVTPHAEIAAMFGERAVRLPWRTPPAPAGPPRRGEVFAFPGPTLARKGAYELRDAAQRLGVPVRPLGSELEGPDFWTGVTVDRAPGDGSWLDGVRAVVHPALVEAAPRRLLEALAAGVPVIATEACGIMAQPGLALVAPGDAQALAQAMRAIR